MNDVNQACNGGDKKTWFTSPFEVKPPESQVYPPVAAICENRRRKPCQVCLMHKPRVFRICNVCTYKVGIGCTEAEPCWNAHSGRCTWCVKEEMRQIRRQWYQLEDVLPGQWRKLNEALVGLILDFVCPILTLASFRL